MWRAVRNDPLQSFAVASGAVSKPGGDAVKCSEMHYISLLIIPCIIYYVTNKETLTLVRMLSTVQE